jgi:hypothetical protein
MRIVMIFLDGVGIGNPNSSVNPLIAAELPVLRSLTGEFSFDPGRDMNGLPATSLPLDATLGVEGLPQSGTGQTALFTGVNASQKLGRHFGPYPHSTLRPIIRETNLLKRLRESGKRVHFANAFPQRFFDHVAARPNRITVTTLACLSSDIPLMRAEDLIEQRAISADITNAGWHDLGYPQMPVVAPEEAGKRLAQLSVHYDFTLFEYWKTDHAGHSMSMNSAIEVLVILDKFLDGVLSGIEAKEVLLMITSDHGNIENIATKVHTRNPVPLILYGDARQAVLQEVLSHREPDLTHVAPAILRCLMSAE